MATEAAKPPEWLGEPDIPPRPWPCPVCKKLWAPTPSMGYVVEIGQKITQPEIIPLVRDQFDGYLLWCCGHGQRWVIQMATALSEGGTSGKH